MPSTLSRLQVRRQARNLLSKLQLAWTLGAARSLHNGLAVPPVCGTLWLFPDSIPHCVLGSEEVVGCEPLDKSAKIKSGDALPANEARISVAINIIDVVAPQPRDGRLESPVNLQNQP